ncbi:MAG: pyridoxamine 5'-phosphate oxidase family protein [Phycisphaerales bacterium]|nr:pyridoxamine 5'-phosphate oxidase family protein [Phycisphaerales bacterium]
MRLCYNSPMVELTTDQISDLLDNTLIGRLCMASQDGRPYLLPFPFCWADGAIYLRVAMTGRKGEILTQNPQVCFEIDTFTDTLDQYASVLAEGRIETVTNLDEKARIRTLNSAKYQRLRKGHRPGHGRQTPLEALPLCKIIIAHLSGRRNDPPQVIESQGVTDGRARPTCLAQ